MLEMHPGWEYKLWTYENMPKLFNQEAFDTFSLLCFKSDILRYEILEKYGGLYIDTDFLFYKNMDSLLNRECLVSNEKSNWDKMGVTNAILGFPPNHFLMYYMIRKIPEKMYRYQELLKTLTQHDVGLRLVGPYMLEECIKEICPELPVLHHKYFYPMTIWDMEYKQLEVFPEAYAAHLWNFNCGLERMQVHKTLPCYKRDHPNETGNA